MKQGASLGRSVLAVIAVIGVIIVLGEIPLPEGFDPRSDYWMFLSQLRDVITTLLAFVLGAFVARRAFIVDAIVITFCMWCLITYILYEIARPVNQHDLGAILANNTWSMVLSFLTAIIGVRIGYWLYLRRAGIGEDPT